MSTDPCQAPQVHNSAGHPLDLALPTPVDPSRCLQDPLPHHCMPFNINLPPNRAHSFLDRRRVHNTLGLVSDSNAHLVLP